MGLFESWAAEAGASKEVCRSAAIRIRNFLKNERGCCIDSATGALIYGPVSDELFDESVDQSEG